MQLGYNWLVANVGEFTSEEVDWFRWVQPKYNRYLRDCDLYPISMDEWRKWYLPYWQCPKAYGLDDEY